MIKISQLELPNQTKQVLIICQYEILKYLRGKKIIAVIGFSIVFSFLIAFLPDLFGTEYPEIAQDYYAQNLNFVLYLIIISAAFFGSNSIITEFHDRTGYSLFLNPVSRTSIWLGKFFAAEIIVFSVVMTFFGIILLNGLITYDSLPEHFVDSLLFSFIVSIMFMSFAFFVSSFARGPTSAAVIIFLAFIVVFPTVDQTLINFADFKPWFSPTFISKIIDFILIDPYPIDLVPGELPRGPFDHHRFVPYIDESLSMIMVYILVSSFLSIIGFQKKQMN